MLGELAAFFKVPLPWGLASLFHSPQLTQLGIISVKPVKRKKKMLWGKPCNFKGRLGPSGQLNLEMTLALMKGRISQPSLHNSVGDFLWKRDIQPSLRRMFTAKKTLALSSKARYWVCPETKARLCSYSCLAGSWLCCQFPRLSSRWHRSLRSELLWLLARVPTLLGTQAPAWHLVAPEVALGLPRSQPREVLWCACRLEYC